jgi:NAD(P)-dependent dehydrogenase (short-subunit alcohol dehydrogenase family)
MNSLWFRTSPLLPPKNQFLGKKTIVITGATSGIGRAMAFLLGDVEAHLVLVGRNEREGERLARRISSNTQNACARFYRTDLSCLAEVQKLASQLKESYERIDILINNAGARFSHFEETSDGIERTFATNHLGHFLLTALLLDRLLQAPAARVITVGSSAHCGINGHPSWMLTRHNYERKLAYGTSKLANLVFAFELARRLSGTTVTSNAIDPGGVATNLGRNNGWIAWFRHLTYYAWKLQLITARRAATHIIDLAQAEEFEGITGQYFHERKVVSSSAASRDLSTARELWSSSIALTGIDSRIGRAWEYMRPSEGP